MVVGDLGMYAISLGGRADSDSGGDSRGDAGPKNFFGRGCGKAEGARLSVFVLASDLTIVLLSGIITEDFYNTVRVFSHFEAVFHIIFEI